MQLTQSVCSGSIALTVIAVESCKSHCRFKIKKKASTKEDVESSCNNCNFLLLFLLFLIAKYFKARAEVKVLCTVECREDKIL